MARFEEVAYDAVRHALADQERLVAGVRQSTGTLLAAHALVASFLGAEALHAAGLTSWSWIGIAALFAGLLLGVALLSSWRLSFAIDPGELLDVIRPLADREASQDGLRWLSELSLGYERLRDYNAPMVKRMAFLSSMLAVLVIVQMAGWIASLAGVG